jgi:hypothetical protein
MFTLIAGRIRFARSCLAAGESMRPGLAPGSRHFCGTLVRHVVTDGDLQAAARGPISRFSSADCTPIRAFPSATLKYRCAPFTRRNRLRAGKPAIL